MTKTPGFEDGEDGVCYGAGNGVRGVRAVADGVGLR